MYKTKGRGREKGNVPVLIPLPCVPRLTMRGQAHRYILWKDFLLLCLCVVYVNPTEKILSEVSRCWKIIRIHDSKSHRKSCWWGIVHLWAPCVTWWWIMFLILINVEYNRNAMNQLKKLSNCVTTKHAKASLMILHGSWCVEKSRQETTCRLIHQTPGCLLQQISRFICACAREHLGAKAERSHHHFCSELKEQEEGSAAICCPHPTLRWNEKR